MKILIADKMSEKAFEILTGAGFEVDKKPGLSEDELVEAVKGYDGVIVRSGVKITPKIIEASDVLKVIGRAGVGVDNINVPAATKKNILVMNTPGGNVNSAAEHTIALMLALSRHVYEGCKSTKECKWERSRFVGSELQGKTLGILGFGRVGKILAKFARAFDMKILAYDPFTTPEDARKHCAEKTTLEDLLKTSDYISVHTPLNDETRGLIGAKEIAMMKTCARVINVGRGGIVDEKALYDALKDCRIAGAAIDVWEKEPPGDNPLLQLESVLATPHLGASTHEAQIRVAVDIAYQIANYLKEGKIEGAVNKVPAPSKS